jgi:hypothetical protein
MLQRFYKDGLICFKYYFFIKTLADIYILSSYFYGPQRINFTLDFLYGSQQVVSQEWKFIPNNKNPTKTNVTTSHDSFLRLDRDSRQISQGNIFYFPISPSQKPWSSHKCSRYFLFRIKQIAHSSSQNPQNYHTCSCHTTTLEILDTIILSLVLVPTKKIPNL